MSAGANEVKRRVLGPGKLHISVNADIFYMFSHVFAFNNEKNC